MNYSTSIMGAIGVFPRKFGHVIIFKPSTNTFANSVEELLNAFVFASGS